jgi:hypothetical protein
MPEEASRHESATTLVESDEEAEVKAVDCKSGSGRIRHEPHRRSRSDKNPAGSRRLTMVKFLLENGADPTIPDNEGNLALFLAAEKACVPLSAFKLLRGAATRGLFESKQRFPSKPLETTDTGKRRRLT